MNFVFQDLNLGRKATVIKGDGIGPEVVDSMIKVLQECNTQTEIILADAGSEQWQKNGEKDPTYIPEQTMKLLESNCLFCVPVSFGDDKEEMRPLLERIAFLKNASRDAIPSASLEARG